MKLSREASQVVVIDIQERLAPAMAAGSPAIDQTTKLLRCAERLQVPVCITEQYRKGIGATLPSILDAAGPDASIFEKMTFSATADDAIATHVSCLARNGKQQIVICGMEAHVCVLQTALDLIDAGHQVAVVVDAVVSRAMESKEFALRRMQQAGVELVTTEMVVFEWLGKAGTDAFRALLPLLK